MKKYVLGFLLSLFATAAIAQAVQQSGTVTPNHVPTWITNGVIGDAGTASDSPVSSFGVTNNGGPGLCVSTGRSTAAGRQQLCFSASLSGNAQITLQNYGTAAAQSLQFSINGSIVTLPTGGSGTIPTITIPQVSGAAICASGTAGALTGCGVAISAGTQYSVPYFSTTAILSSSTVGTNGQLFLGQTSAAPTWFTASGDVTSISSLGAFVIGKVNGATFPSSYTIGDLLYASGGSVVSKLADVAVNSVLASGGVGVAPAYSSNITIATLSTTGLISAGLNFTVQSGGYMGWASGSLIQSPSDGVIKLANNAVTDFGRLQFGGTSSSFPALKRSSTAIAVRLADDSADAPITASLGTFSGLVAANLNLEVQAAGYMGWSGSSLIQSPSDGVIKLANNAVTSFGRLQFGGTSSSFPALKRSSTAIAIRLADDSADAPITASTFTASSLVSVPNGSAGAPSINFGTANVGLYQISTTILGTTVGGNLRAGYNDGFGQVLTTGFGYTFSSTTNLTSVDTGLFRNAAGVVEINNGAVGTYRDILIRDVLLAKRTAVGAGPGAALGNIELVCGTNVGSAKLIAYAGTSSTPVTITDNIGSGVSGC